MRPLKHQVLTAVGDLQILKELQPHLLQLVRIVLEQLEVVAHGRKNFIKLLCVVLVVLRNQGLRHLRLLANNFRFGLRAWVEPLSHH